MRDEYKKRLWNVLKPVLEILVIGSCYYMFVSLTGLSIPCPFYLLTDKYCPGCGITRMFIAMLQGDFQAAFAANSFLFLLFPCMVVYGVVKGVCYVAFGEKKTTVTEQIIVCVLFIITIVFWILRNIEAYSFLAPTE